MNIAVVSIDPLKYLYGKGKCRWSEAPNPKQPSFYFPDFFLQNSKPYLLFDDVTVLSAEELLQNLPQSSSFCLPPFKVPSESAFREAFKHLHLFFPKIKKAVPYLFAEGEGVDFYSALKKVVGKSHLYGFWCGEEGMLGVTPELLLRREGHKLYTEAVAATLPFSENLSVGDFGPCLQEEHQMVIEGIQHSLSPFGSLSIGKREVVSFGSIAHLKSQISVDLRDNPSASSVLNALHPTPALGTYPKESAWLREYNKRIARHRFGAPAGYVLPGGEEKYVVAIRNIQWEGKRARIGIGCGIIFESCYEKQWREEWKKKFQAIQELFSMNSVAPV